MLHICQTCDLIFERRFLQGSKRTADRNAEKGVDIGEVRFYYGNLTRNTTHTRVQIHMCTRVGLSGTMHAHATWLTFDKEILPIKFRESRYFQFPGSSTKPANFWTIPAGHFIGSNSFIGARWRLLFSLMKIMRVGNYTVGSCYV